MKGDDVKGEGPVELSARERAHLRRALALARRGRWSVSPNPMVGCVITNAEGTVVGEGYHRRPGGPHAEADALANVHAAHGAAMGGAAARGGTAYVTLEPCNHHGRTAPCSEALIAAGIGRVVSCHGDPNPEAAGGHERLRAAGVEAIVAGGDLGARAARLNWRFLINVVARRPAVTLKWAMSLDGKIATSSGESQWISSPPARKWALDERETHDAILVGSGTALADDPQLDRRRGRAPGPNLRVVLDRRLRLDPAARMFDRDGEVVVYTADTASADARGRLEARGAVVVPLDDPSPAAVLADLHGRGVRSLLVEGGGEIIDAFVRDGLFDRVALIAAPMLIGGREAPGPLGGRGTESLAAAPRLESIEVARRGPDLLIRGFRPGCLPALYASVGL